MSDSTKRNGHTAVFERGRQAALAGEARDLGAAGYSTEGKGRGWANSWLRGYDSVPERKRGSGDSNTRVVI